MRRGRIVGMAGHHVGRPLRGRCLRCRLGLNRGSSRGIELGAVRGNNLFLPFLCGGVGRQT